MYPWVTEDVCGPILERSSGLKRGVDFQGFGYSPERINPGDKEHTLEKIHEGRQRRGRRGDARPSRRGLHGANRRAPARTVPLARHQGWPKQRKSSRIRNVTWNMDALMNELAIIFDRMGIRTARCLQRGGDKVELSQVPARARFGWPLHRGRPVLHFHHEGAAGSGTSPRSSLTGRRINNNMGPYVAQRVVKLLIEADITVKGARVGVLGLTFKEDCNDIRNSKVPDILRELRQFGIEAIVHDPLANAREAMHEYGLKLAQIEEMDRLDALVLAVSHRGTWIWGRRASPC